MFFLLSQKLLLKKISVTATLTDMIFCNLIFSAYTVTRNVPNTISDHLPHFLLEQELFPFFHHNPKFFQFGKIFTGKNLKEIHLLLILIDIVCKKFFNLKEVM